MPTTGPERGESTTLFGGSPAKPARRLSETAVAWIGREADPLAGR